MLTAGTVTDMLLGLYSDARPKSGGVFFPPSEFPSRSAEGGECNSRFKNDRLSVEMDSGIKFSFNFVKKYCSMFGYQLTVTVLNVWAISVKITRWISFTVKEVDRGKSSKRGECPCFADERCFAF